MFDVYNEWPEELTVGWNISDLGISNASNLSQSEFIMVMIEENYTSQGLKEPQIKAYSGSFITSFMDSFRIYIVELFDLQVLKQGIESTVTELFVRSNDENRRIDWKYDSGEEVINSNITTDLNDTDVLILIESNYSGEGVYPVNASINSSQFNDEYSGVVIS